MVSRNRRVGQGLGLLVDRQVADADFARVAAALLEELVERGLQVLEVIGHGVGRSPGGLHLAAVEQFAMTVNGALQVAIAGVDHQLVGMDRGQGVFGQGVELEVLFHVFEVIFLIPARHHGPGDLGGRHARMRGDEWHQPAQLSHRQAVAQAPWFFGQQDGVRGGVHRSVQGYGTGFEVGHRPVGTLVVLMPDDAGHALGGEAGEQVGTPAFAVEHQGGRR